MGCKTCADIARTAGAAENARALIFHSPARPVRDAARFFLLSPAHCGGRRARQLLSENATFELAQQVRAPDGAPLGDVFRFVSGLYFRGKLAYGRAFARSGGDGTKLPGSGVFVITPDAGLMDAEARVDAATIRRFAATDVAAGNPAYRIPLERSARALQEAANDAELVLLGSLASDKYVDVLAAIFGERLLFPSEFVGRGDMSRGGLMLRSVAAGQELRYEPVRGAVRRGPRPPKLERLQARPTSSRSSSSGSSAWPASS
jgi:hypothetical protein